MTPKQERFAAEYAVDCNATAAARRAGYSPKTAEVQGPRLLGNVRVQAEIQKHTAKHLQKVAITAEHVLSELGKMAFADVADTDERFRYSDKVKALELLGKHLKLFTDKWEHEFSDNQPYAVNLRELFARAAQRQQRLQETRSKLQ